MSPRGAASLSAAALAAAQVSATPIPAAHLLYQQFLSAGAVAAQSQLLQGTAAVSQTAPSLPPPAQILPQAAAAAANAVAVAAQQQQQQSVPSQQQQTASAPQSQQQQQQQQNQAFVLANAAQALAINQLLLQQNPLQQQVDSFTVLMLRVVVLLLSTINFINFCCIFRWYLMRNGLPSSYSFVIDLSSFSFSQVRRPKISFYQQVGVMRYQVQAALAQLLNPFAYYQPHLTALLQQSQLTAANHIQQPQQPPQIQGIFCRKFIFSILPRTLIAIG